MGRLINRHKVRVHHKHRKSTKAKPVGVAQAQQRRMVTQINLGSNSGSPLSCRSDEELERVLLERVFEAFSCFGDASGRV